MNKMIFATFMLLFFFVQTAIRAETYYEVSSKHGGNGGSEFKFECPFGGAITGIKYRSEWRVDQVEFICTSSLGKSNYGPYGLNGGSPGSINCPQGHYVSSFVGRSAERLDRLGIRCRPQGDMNSEGNLLGEFGGDGGVRFDDLALSIGARPVSITIRSADEVDAIQVTYANISINGQFCTDCSEYKEELAPQHGDNGGTLASFVCPAEGVITGIKYRSSWRLDSIEFICTSPLGETTFGPFGGTGGIPGEEKCPPDSYIGSIHGRSAEKVDKLGIRCVAYGQVGGSPKRDGHGGDGGQPFDDESFTTNGRRPVEIRIRSGWEVDAIQIKYGNMPVAFKCKVSKIEVTDKTINAQHDGIEVIGVSSGSSCAPIQQQLTLQTSQSVTESIGVDTMEGKELSWSTEVSLTFTAGVDFGVKTEFSVGLSKSSGGSKSWSQTRSTSTSTGSDKSQGTTIGYQGPGACIVVGFMNRYKIERDNLPVLYHFKCDVGSIIQHAGKISLASNTFGYANFQDYQFQFNSEANCTSEARACVAAIKANNIISDPQIMESQLQKCFTNVYE